MQSRITNTMLNQVTSLYTPVAFSVTQHSSLVTPNRGMEEITSILADFSAFPLENATAINLNARFDAKYLLPLPLLADELISLKRSFLVQLNAHHAPISLYATRYWDSQNFAFFHDHATNRTNRMKVRKRLYEDTGECFLEIKRKRHEKTVKIRTSSPFTDDLNEADQIFLRHNGVDPTVIFPVLDVHYRRVTLWDSSKQGRITIDLNYEVSSANESASYPGVAIVEIKGSRKYINHTAKEFHIPLQRYRTGFSKYGIGIIKLNKCNSSEAKELYKTYKRLIKLNTYL